MLVPPRNRLETAPALDLDGLTEELAHYADDVDLRRRAPVEGLAALGRRGLMGALIPPAWGGLDLTPAQLFEAAAAIGAGCGATGLIWGQHLAATAFIARWGDGATRALLPEAASGERLLGIGVGYTSRPGGPVQAHHDGDRVRFSGDATWVTGAALMTDALLSAEDAEQGGILMAVLPRDALTVHPPYQLTAVTGGMNCTVSFRDVDVTGSLLATPRDRAQTSAVFTRNKSPRDAGFYTGLTRACLALVREARGLDAPLAGLLDRIDSAAQAAAGDMRAWLERHRFEDIDTPPFWARYHRTARVMWEAAGLVMSAGGSGGLRDGATHNRLAREAMYYLARIPLRSRLPEAVAYLDA
jgi:alkylation response protein AidB-like acyl-CoA dehydrogenase